MITAKFKLEWEGNQYNQRLHRNLVQAVAKSAMLVQRSTKELLKTSGQAAIKPTGLNRTAGKQFKGLTTTQKNLAMFYGGLNKVQGLKTAVTKDKSVTLRTGGTYQGVKRIYWNNSTRRWTTSSAPGTPPHKQSGELQRRIYFQVFAGGLKAKVGPGEMLIYGRIQELGGQSLVKLPARPYLRPAFEANQQAILFQFALAVQKAAK